MDVFWFLLSIKFHFQQLVKIQNKDTLAAELTLRKKKHLLRHSWLRHFRPHLNASQSGFIPPLRFARRLTVRTREADGQNPTDGLYSWTLQLDPADGVSGLRWSVKQPLGAPRLSVNISPCVRRLWLLSRLLVTVWSADPQPWVPAVSTDDDDDDDEGDCWVRLVIIGDYWWLLRRLISRLKS